MSTLSSNPGVRRAPLRIAARVNTLIQWSAGDDLEGETGELDEEFAKMPFSEGATPFDDAAVALIEQIQGGFNLVRLSIDGALAGDTWHQTLEQAKEAARDEFGESLGPWLVTSPPKTWAVQN
jgi:hypothetical protein